MDMSSDYLKQQKPREETDEIKRLHGMYQQRIEVIMKYSQWLEENCTESQHKGTNQGKENWLGGATRFNHQPYRLSIIPLLLST